MNIPVNFATQSPSRLTDRWIIIGAGIHGTHLATRLVHDKGVSQDQILLVDPYPPLELWKRRTRNTGMRYLRSSETHHIGTGSSSLRRWVKKRGLASQAWSGKYSCPRRDLFNAHCDGVIAEYGLHDRWAQDRVVDLQPEDSGFLVQLASGRELQAENVVLAMGQPAGLQWPEWIPPEADARHLLDPDFDLTQLEGDEPICILGGGMTGSQAALSLSKTRRVHLLLRHQFRIQDFDFATDWAAFAFSRLSRLDGQQRRSLIRQKKLLGSINPKTSSDLAARCRSGALSLHQASEGTWLGSTFRWGEEEFRSSPLLLATGFIKSPPGGGLVEILSRKLDLPVSPCGYPLTGPDLRWTDGLYVMGALAELNVGPCSANILGARLAATAILG